MVIQENDLVSTKFSPVKHLAHGGNTQLIAQFRIFPSSESRHSFVANYTSAIIFEKHILVLFCCIIIPLYVCESKYLNLISLLKWVVVAFFGMLFSDGIKCFFVKFIDT